VLPLQISFVLAHIHYCHSFNLKSENVERGIPTLDEQKCFISSFYTAVFLETFQAEVSM
jgi:hypothetical protein